MLDARILEQLVAACRARRPAFAILPGAVETLVRALLGKADDPAAALAVLHLEDLYLSAACALSDPHALAEFDSRILPGAVRAAARLDGSRDFADEVAQAVRGRLFTAEPGEKPRIAGYAGRASLESWTFPSRCASRARSATPPGSSTWPSTTSSRSSRPVTAPS